MTDLYDPDFEALAVAYLNPLLTPEVSTIIPSTRPATFVRVQAAGGGGVRSYVLAEGVLSVECWAANTVAASTLARTTSAHLRSWEGLTAGSSFIYSATTTTPRVFPDPLSASPRYVFTATVTARATATA